MSIFKAILDKIFPSSHPANDSAAPSTASVQAPGAQPAVAAAPAPSTLPEVDVQAVLADLQSKHSQPLNWKTSIVDLLKLLDLDSSLQARKSLAVELGYTGSTDDSAALNVWLHKQVIRKLAENGGKLPDDLKA